MLNIKRTGHVPNTSIYAMAGSEPLIHCVTSRQFLGHILRPPPEEPARRYALDVPQQGRRRSGCPAPATFDIGSTFACWGMGGGGEGMLQQDQIATLARDRSA